MRKNINLRFHNVKNCLLHFNLKHNYFETMPLTC